MLLVPAFAAMMFLMYWSLPIGCILYKIPFLQAHGKRDDMFQWARLLAKTFRVSYYKVGDIDLHRSSGPIVYLHNHRCWADFFLDPYVTEARGAPLSRWAVFPCFPIFLTSALTLGGAIFFKRNRVVDFEVFNQTLERKVLDTAYKGVLAYPEGHRSTKDKSLPLKRGFLRFVHSRKWPAQIVITKGKEQVMSEKELKVGIGARLACGYAEVINSADYPDFGDYLNKVQEVWDETWERVYSAPPSSKTWEPGAHEDTGIVYPGYRLVLQGIVCSVSIVLLLLNVYAALTVAFSSPLMLSVSLMMGAATLTSLTLAVK